MSVAAVRSVVFFLSFAFGIMAMGVGLNALVKANQMKTYVYSNAPAGVTVHINISDAQNAAIIAAVAAVVSGIVSAIMLIYTNVTARASPKVLRTFAYLEFFFCAWTFAAMVPYVDFVVNRSPKVTASAGGVPLPESAIVAFAQSIDVPLKYWQFYYLHYVVIMPWFAVLFGVIAGVMLLHAASAQAPASFAGAPVMSEKTSAKNESDTSSLEKKEPVSDINVPDLV